MSRQTGLFPGLFLISVCVPRIALSEHPESGSSLSEATRTQVDAA